ncbi:MAG: hypothetical protein KBD66_01195 [Candidatus Doudnabacteria bacterium]|nr:hypothetical protein [Candidatus Doudnabacteria bacterium]
MGSFVVGAGIAALTFMIFIAYFRSLGHEWAGWLLSVLVIFAAIALFATEANEEAIAFIGGLIVGSLVIAGVLYTVLPPNKGGP